MARRLAKLSSAAMLVAAVMLTACGSGSSRGLTILDQAGVGFNFSCGTTANWEAAGLANDAKRPVTIVSVALDRAPAGFTVEWARAYEGPQNEINESKAKQSVIGMTIPPTPPDDSGGGRSGRHLVIGLRPPDCRHEARGQGYVSHHYQLRDGAIVLGYRVGDKLRKLRLGSAATFLVCSGRTPCKS